MAAPPWTVEGVMNPRFLLHVWPTEKVKSAKRPWVLASKALKVVVPITPRSGVLAIRWSTELLSRSPAVPVPIGDQFSSSDVIGSICADPAYATEAVQFGLIRSSMVKL